jgi:hypothetical protein
LITLKAFLRGYSLWLTADKCDFAMTVFVEMVHRQFGAVHVVYPDVIEAAGRAREGDRRQSSHESEGLRAQNPSRQKEGQIRTPVGEHSRIVFNKRASLVQSSEAFPSRVVKPAASRHSSMAGITSAKKGLLTSETIRPTAGAGAGWRDTSFLRAKKAGFIDRSNRQNASVDRLQTGWNN